MSLSRATLVLAALLGVLVVSGADTAVGQGHCGIPVRLGDSVTTEISPGGDVDAIVFDACAGTKTSFVLGPTKGSPLVPALSLVSPSGAVLDLTAHTKLKKAKTVVSGFVLPETGRYALRVAGADGTDGGFQLKTKGTPPKKWVTKDVALNPGETMDFPFAGESGAKVTAKIKFSGGPFEVLSVKDPDGVEFPGMPSSFVFSGNSAKAVLYPSGSLGMCTLTVGNATSPATLTVTLKTKLPRFMKQKLAPTHLEPRIDQVEPEAALPDAIVSVKGENFCGEGPVDLEVHFGDLPSPEVTFVSPGEITARVPNGVGPVGVRVVNPDGQDGSRADAFLVMPPPPAITTVTPVEGPDTGGTTVDVFGENFTYIEEVFLGGAGISGAPQIVDDGHLTFTTEAHLPGAATLVLRDRFGRSASETDAFEFFGPPVVGSVSPDLGLASGGAAVTVTGSSFHPSVKAFLDGTEVAVTHVDETRLELTSPAHAAGVVDLRVEDPWGRSATVAGAFEYLAGLFADVTSEWVPANTDSVDQGGSNVLLRDVDGQGGPDLLIGRSDPPGSIHPTRLFLNDGSGGFAEASSPGFDGFDADALVLGDLDADGDLDLVVTMDDIYTKPFRGRMEVRYGIYYYYYYFNVPYASTRVFFNDGDGEFHLSRALLPDPAAAKGTDLLQGTSLALGDLDKDGDLDLVVTRRRNVGESSWSDSWVVLYPYYMCTRTFSTEYLENTPATRVLLNDGLGSFTDVTSTAIPAVSAGDIFAGDAVLLADADNDGDLDIVVSGDGSNLRDASASEYVSGSKTRILRNDGTGKFTNATSSLLPATKPADDWGGTALAFGDLDGDAIGDLVVALERSVYYRDHLGRATFYSSTRVFAGGGASGMTEKTGTILPAVRADGWGEMWRAAAVVIADPDGDGRSDLFLVDRAPVEVLDAGSGKFDEQVSSTRWLSNTGSMPLTDLTRKAFPDPASRNDFYLGDAILLGDLDGDGDLDMVITTLHPSYSTSGAYPTRVFEFRK